MFPKIVVLTPPLLKFKVLGHSLRWSFLGCRVSHVGFLWSFFRGVHDLLGELPGH